MEKPQLLRVYLGTLKYHCQSLKDKRVQDGQQGAWQIGQNFDGLTKGKTQDIN